MNRIYVPLVAGMVALAAPLARADEAAQKLLGEVAEKVKATRTFTAEIAVSGNNQKIVGKLFLQRPNLGRVEMGEGKQAMLMLSDGTNQYQVLGGKYLKKDAIKDLADLWPPFGAPIEKIVGPGEPHLVEKETIEGVAYDVIEVKNANRSTRIFISPEKVIERIRMGAGADAQEIVVSNVRLDAEIAAETFQLPAGVEERKPDEGGRGAGALEKNLVPVGKPAPAFSLKTPAGGTLSLAQALKGKKAVLVNFWFYGCGPCRAEFPHLQKLYAGLKGKGLELVAINNGDDKSVINRYLAKEKFTFRVVQGTAKTFAAFGVQAYPTNYVVDASGRVVFRSVGFDEDGIKKALAKLGVK